MGDPGSEDLRERLRALRIEHRDLDEVIQQLSRNPATDELLLRRLKRRKLQLKDFIAKIESKLIPDLEA